jgi:hypothetical protein
MLIEQAFYNLPEILTGFGYAEKNYEAGIVSAYSLALLQELNGRNMNLPISAIYVEQPYFKPHGNHRCDLFIDLFRKLYVGSAEYSEFGFRYYNWMEAKFFRSTKSVQKVSSLVTDIFRLLVLPEPLGKFRHTVKEGKPTYIARYMLHVYKGDPKTRLEWVRQDGSQRSWLDELMQPGFRTIADFELNLESNKFFSTYAKPGLMQIKVTNLMVTNRVIEPRPVAATGLINPKLYKFVLTRLDSATIEFGKHKLTVNADMTYDMNGTGELDEMRKAVLNELKSNQKGRKKGSKGKKASKVMSS